MSKTKSLPRRMPPKYSDKHDRERAVDEGAVDEEVYLVEPVAQDGYAHGHRHTGEAKVARRPLSRFIPERTVAPGGIFHLEKTPGIM